MQARIENRSKNEKDLNENLSFGQLKRPEQDYLLDKINNAYDEWGWINLDKVFKAISKIAKNNSHLYQLWSITGYNRSVLENKINKFHWRERK